MRHRSSIVIAVFMVTAAAAGLQLGSCTKTNPIYCEADSDCASGFACDLIAHECAFDGRDGGDGTGCTSSATCPDDAPICNDDRVCSPCVDDAQCGDRGTDQPFCRADGACVECRGDAECTDPTAGFCNAGAGVCRGCLDDSECPSEVCNRDLGNCADAAGILYVDNQNGTDSESCGDQSQPCASIGLTMGALPKVGPGRRTIKVRAGQGYPESLVLDGVAVVISGSGATISPIIIDTPTIAVRGGANVTLEGLTITGASGSDAADGVHCGGTDSIVRLTGVTIEQNAALGVDVEAPCDVRIARSVIRTNGGGGVFTTGSSYVITHSMIVDNGGAGAGVGGVVIGTTDTSATQRIDLNTIAGNQRSSGAGGLACGAALTSTSSIVWGNSGAEANANCSFVYSDVDGGATGTGNLDADPLFVGAGDYHLTQASPCIDTADPSAGLGIDVDGDDRPAGAGTDMGADETPGATP